MKILLLLITALQSFEISAQELDSEGQTYLHKMIMGNAQSFAIEEWLNKEPVDVNAQTMTGISAVMMAASKARLDLIMMLRGAWAADLTLKDRQGQNALHWAIKGICLNAQMSGQIPDEDFFQTIRYLEANLPIDSADNDQLSPLMLAAVCSHFGALQLLIELKAPLNQQDRKGWGPLHYATIQAVPEISDELLKSGSSVNLQTIDGTTALMQCLKSQVTDPSEIIIRRAELIKSLIKAGADVNLADSNGVTPLIQAASFYGGDMLRVLREANANPNVIANNGDYALAKSIEVLDAPGLDYWCRDPEVCFEPNAQTFRASKAPLQCLAETDLVDWIQAFRARGAKINCMGAAGSALHHAARKGQIEMIRRLSKEGADANLQDSNGETALLSALKAGQFQSAEVLLRDAYANPNLADHSGLTPLIASIGNPDPSFFWLLSNQARVDPNLGMKQGDAPIHFLTRQNRIEELKLLMKRKLDFNALGAKGRTAVQIASIEGHLEMLRFLIEVGGANYKILDEESFSALDYAESMGRKEIAEYLKSLP